MEGIGRVRSTEKKSCVGSDSPVKGQPVSRLPINFITIIFKEHTEKSWK
jgi:hypothetical protein